MILRQVSFVILLLTLKVTFGTFLCFGLYQREVHFVMVKFHVMSKDSLGLANQKSKVIVPVIPDP